MTIFSDESLKAAINSTLNTAIQLPDGAKGAFVVTTRQDGIYTAVAARVNDVWEVQGALAFHPATHGLDYGVTVKATWG
jgi:hypothetical protein